MANLCIGCHKVRRSPSLSFAERSWLAALQAQTKPAREHQREIQSRKFSLDNPINNRKYHHTWGQDEPENHTNYTQPIGPRDKPENILQHPGDQCDQSTYRVKRCCGCGQEGSWLPLQARTTNRTYKAFRTECQNQRQYSRRRYPDLKSQTCLYQLVRLGC